MNKKSSKLLAAVAVFAMVFAVFAAVPMVADDANAVGYNDDAWGTGFLSTGATSAANLETAISEDAERAKVGIKLTGDITFEKSMSFTVPVYAEGNIVINKDATVSINLNPEVAAGKNCYALYFKNDAGCTISGEGKLDIDIGGSMTINQTRTSAGAADTYSKYTNVVGIYAEDALNIEVGTLDISVTTEVKGTSTELTQDRSSAGILAEGALTIGNTTTPNKVMIAVNNNDPLSFGIHNTTGGDDTADVVFNGVATDSSISGGNRAVYSYDGVLEFQNCAGLTLTGGEKAVAAGSGGTIKLVRSTVTAVLGNMQINNAGDDEISGVKAANLYVDATSKLYTDGVYVETEIEANSAGNGALGLVEVRGGFAQNPAADLDIVISGLYYKGSTPIDATRGTPSATSTGIYLTKNAETYGMVIVSNGSEVLEDGVDVSEAQNVTAINTKLGGPDLQKYTLTMTTAVDCGKNVIVIPLADEEISAKTLTIIADSTNTFTGTIAIEKANGTNYVELSKFVGSLAISEGSVEIVGSITEGTVKVAGDVKLAGTVDVQTGAELVVLAGSTLNLQGNTLKAIKLKGETTYTADMTGRVAFIGDAKAIGEGDLIIGGDTIVDSTYWQVNGSVSGAASAVTFNGTESFGTVTVTSGTIAGTFTSGTIVIDGSVALSADLVIGEKAKMTVKSGATLDLNEKTLTNNGSIVINGSVTGGKTNDKDDLNGKEYAVINGKTGTITVSGNFGCVDSNNKIDDSTMTVSNEGSIIVADEDAQIVYSITGNGTVDTSAITKEGTWNGSYSSATYGIQQQITVTGPTEITSKALIVFQGTLIVEKDQTLTIKDGAKLVFDGALAKLINYGTIIVESDALGTEMYKPAGGGAEVAFSIEIGDVDGGLIINGATVENYGYIESRAEDPVTDAPEIVINFADGTIVNNGTITIPDDENVLNIGKAKLSNMSAGVINLSGEVAGTFEIKNEGTVTIDNQSSGSITITQTAPTGIVNIVETGADVTVSDDGMVMGKIEGEVCNVDPNDACSITIQPNDNKTVAGGIVITSAAIKEKDKNDDEKFVFVNYMYVAGTITTEAITGATVTETDLTAGMSVTGATVAESFAVAEGVTVTGSLTVAGTMTVAEEAKVDLDALTVTGEFSATVKTSGDVSATTLTVSGKLTSIGYDVSTTTVNAAKYVVKPAAGVTDQKTVYYYSGLKAAIDGAVAASIKEVDATGKIDVEEDVIIPAGITVKYSGSTLTVAAEETLTVDASGKLDIKSGSDVKVNGTLYVTDEKTGITKNADITSDVMSRGVSDVRYTSLASAIAAAGSDEVVIKLNNNTDIIADLVIPTNVTVDTNDKDLTVNECKLTINGILYLNGGNYKVNYDADTKKGAVVLNGYIQKDVSMTFNNKEYPAGVQYEDDEFYYITSLANIGVAVEEDADQVILVNGAVSASDVSISGTADRPVTVKFVSKPTKDFDEKVNDVSAGTITIDYATLVFEDGRNVTATIAGANGSVKMVNVLVDTNGVSFIASADDDDVKTLTVEGKLTHMNDADKQKAYVLAVEGKVILDAVETPDIDEADAPGVYGLTVNGEAVVAGTSVINEVVVNGTMISDNGASVDITYAVVFGTLKVLDATADGKAAATLEVTELYVGYTPTTGATAVIEGDVIFDTAAATAFAAIAAGSQLSEETLETFEDYYSATIDLDGTKVTVYYRGTAPSFDDIFGDIEEMEGMVVTGWKDEAGKAANAIADGKSYTAEIIKDIYEVTITAVDGISNVTIDGQLMTKDGNKFTAIVAAGPHTIAYTLASGYEGTAVLASKDVTVSGMTFTTEGGKAVYDKTDKKITEYVEYDLQLTGITVKDTSASTGGMGLTEILLIVLVVLIAIMAVVIAMRMMRS